MRIVARICLLVIFLFLLVRTGLVLKKVQCISALLGDLLSSSLGVIGFSWITSPACTELETIVMDWLHHMLQLPKVKAYAPLALGVAMATTLSFVMWCTDTDSGCMVS